MGAYSAALMACPSALIDVARKGGVSAHSS
jgi:hypothetical protein